MPWLGIAAVSAGAVVGSLLRWAAGIWLNARWAGFPLGTLFVNCVGGLLIGAVLFWLERSPNELLRLLLVTGLLGGFTTFSAFSAESLIMLQRGQLLLALGHTLAHVIGALACAALGFRLAQVVLLALSQGGRGRRLENSPWRPTSARSGGHPAMRIDKLTTTLQEALGDAQSLAVARDNPYIEPVHVLAALLAQADGPKALLARAGVNVGQAADRRSRTR